MADVADLDDPSAVAAKKDIEHAVGLLVVQIPDPGKAHQAAVRAASAISGPTVADLSAEAPVINDDEVEDHYLSLPMAEVSVISDAGGHGAYMAQIWQTGPILSSHLDATTSNIVIEAEGGAGKSQELIQVVRRAEVPALLVDLSHFDVTTPWVEPTMRFVAGMRRARAARTRCAHVDGGWARDATYVFAFDALDEVPAANRAEILRFLGEVSDGYPQHRYVLGVPSVAGTRGPGVV